MELRNSNGSPRPTRPALSLCEQGESNFYIVDIAIESKI